MRRYAIDPPKKMEEKIAERIPIPTVKANCCNTPVPKINIVVNTNKVDNPVLIDLLMVCRKLSSIIFPTTISLSFV